MNQVQPWVIEAMARNRGLTLEAAMARIKRGADLDTPPYRKPGTTKTSLERELNDLAVASLPATLRKLCEDYGFSGKKPGTWLRIEHKPVFDAYFLSVSKTSFQ